MASQKPRSKPHPQTQTVQTEAAAQTPIIPQRTDQIETGRTRELLPRERVGGRSERELHATPFPPERGHEGRNR